MSESERASLSRMMNVAMTFWLVILFLVVGYRVLSQSPNESPVHVATIELDPSNSIPSR